MPINFYDRETERKVIECIISSHSKPAAIRKVLQMMSDGNKTLEQAKAAVDHIIEEYPNTCDHW